MKNPVAIALSAGLLLLAVAAGVQAHAAPADPTFDCMREGVKIRNTYIRNADPVKLKKAVEIFDKATPGVDYPTGTVIQLVPNEAMIKRTSQEFPNSGGWEFFALTVAADGTKIAGRGDQASNRGGTCLSCHSAGAKFDYVCERTHGCAPVPLTDEIIAKLQAGDPRCAAAAPKSSG